MGFLKKLLSYKNICIQCHDNPDADAIASAFGAYRYLQSKGIESSIIYGGNQVFKKNAIKMMVRECNIPIQYVESVPDCDVLLFVDCQYGQGNVTKFPLEDQVDIMVIDHHVQVTEGQEDYLIKSDYQSCATIIYELLQEEGYPVKEDQELAIALLYGLYIDTACFADLYKGADKEMQSALFDGQPLLERLMKSSMSVGEVMIASDAMLNHYFDVDYHFAIVETLKCEQSVLGIIGDFMIQVDVVYLSFTYTETGTGYQISIRSCHEKLPANEIAAYVCQDVGGGGGHKQKAGGQIQKEKMKRKYGELSIFEIVNLMLTRYMMEHEIAY